MENFDIQNIETNIYDKRKLITNCIVEILENSITGEVSVGWYKTDDSEVLEEGLDEYYLQ